MLIAIGGVFKDFRATVFYNEARNFSRMNICGIDEAGRGCIVGPMVICGAMLEEKDLPKLDALGVKDSKLLSPAARVRIAGELRKFVKHQIILVPPSQIDEYVLDGSGAKNLNWLEAEKSVELISMLSPNKAIVDCPSPNIKAYEDYMRERLLNKKVEIRAEHKADHKYKIVGAASILAKVARDMEIERIKLQVGEDFGSGYLTDPKTQSFLKSKWNVHAGVFRHSWSPYQELAGLKRQKRIGDF
ncbi:ribonuclease HII [Candidatus Woesearchaeota archaeon]|nr:MAG: ribonuclease HII [Candidatus Woesearchaeota archaeon]